MGSWNRIWVGISLVVAAAVITAGMVSAGIPKKINYQGRLSDSVTGLPLAGPHTLIVRIYNAVSGGSLLWWETAAVEADSEGVFAAVLGSVDPIDLGFDGPCWLEVEADGEVLLPRREMVSVPYAFTADSASRASGADSLGGHGAGEFVLKGETASITASMVVGGTGSGLDADFLDGQHAGAFAGAVHQHDDRYYTESELGTGDGTVNQVADPADWTKLKGVPSGFADGNDNVGAGDGYSLDAADGNPTDVVYVGNDGKVLIGSAYPVVAKLHVVAGPSEDAIYSTTNTGVGAYGYSISGSGVVGGSSTGTGVSGISDTGKAGAFTGDVFVSGDLGVGVAEPAEKIDVQGNLNLRGQISM